MADGGVLTYRTVTAVSPAWFRSSKRTMFVGP
nr:MAG TPA: hypothetical protein [Caudoviricetes sp.]